MAITLVDAVRRFWAESVAALGLKGDLGALLATVECDPALRERFRSDPMALLAERGIALPEGMKVQVVENSTHKIHIVLPPMIDLGGDGEVTR